MYKIRIISVILLTGLFIVKNLQASGFLFSNHELIKKIKTEDNPYADQIIEIADEFLNKEINTLNTVVSPLGEKYATDYFSESPYWWPDPEDPEAPYIRKDGVRNPNRFTKHKELMMQMYQAFTSLSIAAYITEESKYKNKLAELVEDWFINPNTRMAPHLKYAQMIRNKDVIRGVGIIDTHRFVGLIEVLILLKQNKIIDSYLINGVDLWLKEYYTWLTESKWGIDEKYRGNNHSSWWAAQCAAIAVYLGYDNDLIEFFEYSKAFLLDKQFEEECRQPLEEARTLSLNYCTFNLNAVSFLASALSVKGFNLFNYSNINSCKILDAAKYYSYFVENPDDWELEQIKPFHPHPVEYAELIGIKLNDQEFIKLAKRLLKFKRNSSIKDPFGLLLDAQISIIN